MDVMNMLKNASKSKYTSIVEDGTITDIDKFYSTGHLMLNALISANIFNGFLNNKTMCYSGQSKSGKTFLVIENCRNFLEESKENYLIWFASESAINKDMLVNRGLDPKRILFIPVSTIEEFNQEIWEQLKVIGDIKEKKENFKKNFMVVLDSLGQLNADKEFDDLEKGEQKANMQQAKSVKKMFRNIEMKCAYLKIPVEFTNHVYAKIGGYGNQDELAGGSGVRFSSDIIITITSAKVKDSSGNITGVRLTCNSYKNRHAQENKKIRLYIDYKSGLLPYSGIFDFLKDNNFLNKVKKADIPENVKIDGRKQAYEWSGNYLTEDDINTKEFWTKKRLEDLNKIVMEHFSYGSEYSASPKKDVKSSK